MHVPLPVTVDVFKPVLNTTTNVPVPTSVRPAFLGIHGGSYSHGDSTMEYPNVEHFVRRGWVGFSLNYRLCNGGYDLVCVRLPGPWVRGWPPVSSLRDAAGGGRRVRSR